MGCFGDDKILRASTYLCPTNSSNIEIKQKYPIHSKKSFNTGSRGNSSGERWN
jgi:hypothetical protein